MSVDQTNVVDAIGIDNVTGDVIITITDHLGWSENESEHLLLLQEKLNAYLIFIEGGQLLDTYPNAKGRAVLIDIVCKYPLSQRAQGFCDQVTQIIEGAGMKLRLSLFDPA
ncbi:MAG: hypothetical protein LBV49_08135 [Azonexus sp.]|jgi:hypothetical protein|nr:hypothetical protein [Azonexus sp.]